MGVSRVIENIHSSDSADKNPNRLQASFKMPKNVRQIGKSNTTKKIYVEDYVMTYVKQLVGGDYSKCRAAVLVGQCIKLDNCRNIFVSGAVEVKEADSASDVIFTNDSWTNIYEEIKKYFVEMEIVGWFLGGPGYLLEDKDKITKLHIDNFAGQDKALLIYDNMEKEEAFYSFENNRLTKLDGYYIYYEKNEEMQTYMIDHRGDEAQSMEASYDDKVSKNIREVLQNKKAIQEDSKNVTRLMYAAGTLLAVIVLVVGAAILNNYDQMKSMQDTLNHLQENMQEVKSIFSSSGSDLDSKTSVVKGQPSDSTDASVGEDASEASDDSASEDESLDIEMSPGEVKPIDDADHQEETQSNNTQTNSEPEKNEFANHKEDDEEPTSTPGDDLAEEESDEEAVQQVKYYIVKAGDTLADISYKLYNTYTKVQQIMELNNIENQDYIYVGQKLIVP